MRFFYCAKAINNIDIIANKTPNQLILLKCSLNKKKPPKVEPNTIAILLIGNITELSKPGRFRVLIK